MDEVLVLPSATKHGITAQALLEAWENFAAKRPRGDDCWVSIGFDAEGHEIEMVGLITADGRTLIFHGMSPATERMRRELGIAR